MLKALIADAIFIASLFIEVCAALSLLQSSNAIVLREALEPVLAFYRGHGTPIFAFGAQIIWPSGPEWFLDSTVLSEFFFFLFFIAQARIGMSPYSETGAGCEKERAFSRIETLIDWALPIVFCAIGAFILAPTLLPLLTLPAALMLGAKKLLGGRSLFEISASYYLNLLCLGGAVLGILALQK